MIPATAYDVMVTSLSARDMDPSTGFLSAPITIARTGIQTYTARALALDTNPKTRMDPNRVLKLYRPAEEVFAADSLAAWNDKPITIDHPRGGVNSRNWKTVSVGEVRDAVRQGDDTIGARGIVKDQKGIDAVNSGKKFMSGGYDFDLDLTPGTLPTGEAYDGIQRNIRPNHVALVTDPRGGPACRVHDSPGDDKTMKIINIDGVPVSVTDGAESATVEKLLVERDNLKNRQLGTVKVGDSNLPVDNVVPIQAAYDAVVAERDALKLQVVGEDEIERRVQARTKTVATAKKLVPTIATDSKTTLAIQREVIAAVTAKDAQSKAVVGAILGATALDSAKDEVVATAFDAMVAAQPAIKTTANDAAFAAAVTGAQDAAPGAEVVKMPGRSQFLANSAAHLRTSSK